MDSARFSRGSLAFLIGVPLPWAVVLLFHPTGDGETLTYGDLHDQVTAWLIVHAGTMLFIPLMAVAGYLLVRGIEGTAAQVSRIGAILFAVFYGAFEVLVGIGNGILVHNANGLPPGQRAVAAASINDFNDNIFIRGFGILPSIGSIALIVALIAAGIALRRYAAAPLSVPILLALSGFLITAHPPPYGPSGLVLFMAAVVILARSQTAPSRAAPLPQPT